MQKVLVCNDKGGVGKSLTTHLLGIMLIDRRDNFRIIECEKQPRLQLLFDNLVDYRPSEPTSVQDVLNNPDLIFGVWDDLGADLLGHHRCLVDLGAGLTSRFLQWATVGGAQMLKNGAGLTFACVITANRDSIVAGLENMKAIGEVFPQAERFLIQNEKDGTFGPRHEVLATWIDDASTPGGSITEIVLPACRAPAWGHLQSRARFDQSAMLSPEQLAQETGIDTGPAVRSLYLFTDWLQRSMDALEPLIDERDQAVRSAVAQRHYSAWRTWSETAVKPLEVLPLEEQVAVFSQLSNDLTDEVRQQVMKRMAQQPAGAVIPSRGPRALPVAADRPSPPAAAPPGAPMAGAPMAGKPNPGSQAPVLATAAPAGVPAPFVIDNAPARETQARPPTKRIVDVAFDMFVGLVTIGVIGTIFFFLLS